MLLSQLEKTIVDLEKISVTTQETDTRKSLESVLYALKEEHRAEVNKSTSKGGKGLLKAQERAIKKVIKQGEQEKNKMLLGWHKLESQFCFVDGYKLYVLNKNLGYEKSELERNVSNFINYTDKEEKSVPCAVDMADLKLAVKYQKQHKIKFFPYQLTQNNRIMNFSPEFLLDSLTAMGTNVIFLQENGLKPAFIDGKEGEFAMLLPVKLNNNNGIILKTWQDMHAHAEDEQ